MKELDIEQKDFLLYVNDHRLRSKVKNDQG